MRKSSKSLSRKKAFRDYIKRWGMEDFRFFVIKPGSHWNDKMLVIHKDSEGVDPNWMAEQKDRYDEITSLATLLERFRRCTEYKICGVESKKIVFNSLDEFKEYLFIKKLAGI